MSRVRICVCGHPNPPEALFCQGQDHEGKECGEDLSRRPIEEESALQAKTGNAASAVSETDPVTAEIHIHLKPEKVLSILSEDGREIAKARDGDIIGRSATGADYLQNFPTVARHHIQVFQRQAGWWIKNLSQTNGTWLNDQKVPQNEERAINEGDNLQLSTKCRLTVL